MGDFSELFLGHLDWFRGCLSQISYNGVDALKRARARSGQSDAQGVTWSCAPEFDAPNDSEISFIEDGAYISLPNLILRTGVRLQFDLKTVLDHGVLLYSSGPVAGGRADFIGVEILNRRLHLLFDQGNGPIELSNDNVVADGEWHTVTINLNPTVASITVDSQMPSTAKIAAHAGNKYLDLSDMLFFGGIELNKRSKALGQGLKTADASFKGCVRNLETDGRRVGVADVMTSLGIIPQCVWSFPCSQDPCLTKASCSHQGVNSYKCDCDQSTCAKPDFVNRDKMFLKTPLPVALEILTLEPLLVSEGENALITPAHINMVLDSVKYGVRESNILFYRVEPPQHGRLFLEVWERGSNPNQVFTLLDLSQDKVRYLHDGSENHQDSITFDLELSPGAGFTLPNYLKGRHRFSLLINITAVNDPPLLVIPSSKVLKVVLGTRKVLSADLLSASDPDTSPSSLVYSVFNQPQSVGRIEEISFPNVSVTSFTQEDVDQGRVIYAHTGNTTGNSRIGFQVSDGSETSAPSYLRIVVVPLQLKLANNTGLKLVHKTASKITPGNLTFVTNSDDPSIVINYQIVVPPRYGSVQRLQRVDNSEIWQKTDHFTNQQLQRHEIQYHHLSESPDYDEFKFNVSVLDISAATTYDFRLTFVRLSLVLVNNEAVEMTTNLEVPVSANHLMLITDPLYTDPSSIFFEVTKLPLYGILMRRSQILSVGSTFTQLDVNSGFIEYKTHRTTYSPLSDSFSIRVAAQHCSPITSVSVIFNYTPNKTLMNKVRTYFDRLQVMEGGLQTILKSQLSIEINEVSLLYYNVTQSPLYGELSILDPALSSIVKQNVSYFTTEELEAERLVYKHDDSESRTDTFSFVAFSSPQEDFQFVSTFNISVSLKNDNPPICVTSKCLHVVKKGERTITKDVLEFTDSDIDSTPKDIHYTRHVLPKGNIFSILNPGVPLFDFSQAEINAGLIVFQHDGEENANVSLWVSDGVHHTECVLEIEASEPYLRIINNTKLVLQQGGSSFISSQNLFSETNVNIPLGSLRYDIIEGPSHGRLQLVNQSSPTSTFYQGNVTNLKLLYQHNGNKDSIKDAFKFRIAAESVTQEDIFNIRVFPASYWEPLSVLNQSTLIVEESTSVKITQQVLLAQQSNVLPSDIIYHVRKSPMHGYLEVEHSSEDGKDRILTTFDQSMIDSGKVHYVQATANQTKDRIVLDITNGITWSRGVIVNIVVVPEILFLGSGQMRVDEGGSVTLLPLLVPVLSEYYSPLISEYHVTKQPRFGKIISTTSSNSKNSISRFSAQQLQAGQILYVHDGSEVSGDIFTLIAKAGDKESTPANVHVNVTLVNDQPPNVVNNTVLSLWRGGFKVISPQFLAASDKDTPPENLTFAIVSAQNGHVAIKGSISQMVDKFTQEQINNNSIVFVHSGQPMNGEFDFVLSDGVKSSGPHTFRTKWNQPNLIVRKKNRLHVFPLLRKPITASHLLALCSDEDAAVIFVIKRSPSKGILLVNNSTPLTASNFSQADVNQSSIWYQHKTPFGESANNDSFLFDVFSSSAEPIRDQVFNIDISVSHGGIDELLDQKIALKTEEGGSIPIKLNTSGLVSFLKENVGIISPEIQIHVLAPPSNGVLCLMGASKHGIECNITVFTRSQINSGMVTYRHDHSDTTTDEILLSLLLDPGDVLLCNISLALEIFPVNDQPFKLLTTSPKISVVQGQSHIITDEYLATEDSDTEPDQIFYEIVSAPSHGHLILNGSTNVDRFTQADVNCGRVIYVHDGPLQATSFYFRVWDGQFTPNYTIFNIAVLPIKLNITLLKDVFIKQGSSSVLLSESIFSIETNTKLEGIMFNVTTLPKNGIILVHNFSSLSFKHSDLTSKRVMYVQTNMTAPNDEFELCAFFSFEDAPKVNNIHVNVTVDALFRAGQFVPFSGTKVKLTTDFLDASQLAKLSNADPFYRILRKPKWGKLKKIIRSSGEKHSSKEKEVSKFSHEEIRSGVIYYVAKKFPDTQEDSFQFMLSVAAFQPAIEELRFQVIGELGTPTTTFSPSWPRIPGQKFSINPDSGVEIASPNMSDDYLLFVCMISGVIALSIFIVILVRCRSKPPCDSPENDKMDLPAPLPLPRPPDDLMPSSPHPKRHAPPSTRCRVIPMSHPNSVTSSEPERSEADLNFRYPYGTVDEDWSSYEPSESNYAQNQHVPMLRRNQYWV
ncbi:unnamed protein product [Bemisia tabaci]|uniref:Laminin G domain-containing protein n=2 Tax=Bemisia tabaci TaxID=7038 RepID=A0A9P0AMW5_BEMTA|nr:unnamed protein product [Bemisia tabaci]